MGSPQHDSLPFATDTGMSPTIRRRSIPRAPSGRRKPVVRQAKTASREHDRFFRHLVAGMRNGVLAITRDGMVAELNAEAQRIFHLKRSAKSLGRHFSEVLARTRLVQSHGF